MSDTQDTACSQSRAGWGLWGGPGAGCSGALLFSADPEGRGVGLWCLVVLAPWTSPWTPSQQMKDLSCLCAGSIQQYFWNQTLLYVCIVLASKLGHFLKSEQGNLANPDNTGHLISLCVQPTASPNFKKPVMWIVCERGGGYKHAQSFRVDVYKPSFLQHKILSLERLRDVFLASD